MKNNIDVITPKKHYLNVYEEMLKYDNLTNSYFYKKY